MEECESLDSEVTELQEFMSQDDEDEVEELQNSLREVVQDRSVKPKFQCLMVDASFSMVTVQSEDSGIVWETASSRCSTPWASETSSTSEAYSMDGSGAAGKITIVFDENKIVRRRTRSGRSSRLGGSLSRPGSSRSASALGVERPEMAEISLPNVKPDKTETQPDLEEIRNKDQQLFSLISEGYEILNIRVPSKLPTVDEEESTELEDNLSYLDQTPKIRSGNRKDYSLEPNPALAKEGELLDQEPSADTGLREKPSQKESAGDMDYFEKFTLVDVVVPGEQAPELQEDAEQPQAKPEEEEQKPAEEADTNSPSASEDSFVFVTDVDIAGEHLDEVFYGAGALEDASQQLEDEEAESGTTRRRRASHRSLMANGSVLFGAEDTVLTPIFISPGPPKIIDQILLDEPTAMSFMYSDLYEDAVGERRKSDEEHSEAESIASEKTCKRRLSDSDEADGYLEKFILKDETSTVEVQPESVQENREGRMMWSLSEFDMTGCLTRVTTEEDVSKTEDPETKEVSVGDGSDNLQSAPLKGRREIITETEMKDVHVSTVTEGKAVRDASHDPIEAPTLRGDQMGDQGVKHEVKVEAPESSIDEPLNEAQKVDGKVEKAEESAQRPIEVLAETKQPCDTTVVLDAAGETDVAAPVSGEAAHITEISLSKEADEDTETMAAKDKDVTEAVAEASDGVKQMETSAKTSLWEENKAAEVVPGDALLFEVITECDSAVQALVEVIGKTVEETEIQTEVLIDLQEAISVDTTAEEEEKPGVLAEGAAVEGTLPEFITEGYQETEVKAAITSEVTEPAMLDEIKKESDIAQILNSGSMQHQQEEPVTDSELTNKAEDKTPTEDTANVTQEKVNVNDELVLLVPKGQAVEMDIEISQLSRKTPSDPEALYEPDRLTAPETPPACSETPQGPTEPTTTQPRLAVTPDQDTLSRYPADTGSTPPAAEQETYADTPEARSDFEEVEGDFLTLRSLTPQEDLSGSHSEDMKSGEADAEQKAEIHYEGDAPEASKPSTEIDVHREDVEPQMEHDPTAAEASEMTADGLEYEIISKQDAERMPEAETQRAVEEPILESGQERDERMEMQMEIEEEEEEEEEKVLDDELTEADYEIIDAEEESQARLADELRQMVRFCVTCGCLLSEDDCVSGEHQGHEVAAVDEAYKEIKEKLSDWISELQERSENIEDLVSELELAYNSVEDQCLESEAAMQAQNEEMKAVVMEQYNDMSVSMEEEKKAKLEQLYDQIVALQESIDAAKVTLETTAREAETDARTPEDINARIKATLDSAMSLELGPKGLLVFEDYVRGNGSSSHLLSQRKGIPVPQRPTLLPQESGLATSTSVTVYWRVNPGDIIDCFQVYCMEDPQGAVSEEYRVTVKESYCALEELEPDKTYKVWVMAVNYTGCSLPSERLSFRTAPAVPVIETERCTVLWDSATLRWSSASQTPEQSYTLEYCRQYELEGEGLRSISGIQSCEQRVLLQPNESYLFYIKAVNECGSSEQSEAVLISTKGTRFHLLETSAHPALKLSADRTTVHCDAPPADKQCPSILGELLPARGRYYWEAVVSGSAAYRLGVAYDTANRNSPLGENHLSWCLQCIPTPSGCRYQLLHDHILSTMFVIEVPERVGTLLDYQLGRLSFYNARSGQLLGAFCQRFARPCHAALALETPGSLEVSLLPEAPEFTKDS